jgi:uncharacterized protein (TIGR03067 family)
MGASPGAGVKQPSGETDQKPVTLDGTWEMVAFVRDGAWVDQETLQRMREHPIRIAANAGIRDTGEQFDPTASPGTVDVSHPQLAGEYPGIFKVDGDLMLICWAEHERPDAFSPTKENGWMLGVYRRDNPDNPPKPGEQYYRVAPQGDSEPSGSTAFDQDSSHAIPLADAVRAFNQEHADHPFGRKQPPLTEEEVVASVR